MRPFPWILQPIVSRLAMRSTSLTCKCLPRSPRYANRKISGCKIQEKGHVQYISYDAGSALFL